MTSQPPGDTDEPFWLGPVTAEERAVAEEYAAWDLHLMAEDGAEAWAQDRPGDQPAHGGDADDVDGAGGSWERPHAEAAEVLVGRAATLYDAFVIADLDLTALHSPLLALKVARRIDELAAMLAARQAELLVEVAEPTSSGQHLGEVHIETEVALARGVSATVAGWDITVARALATDFPTWQAALARGEVSPGHVRKLVEMTGLIQDEDVRRRIGELALAKAVGRTVPVFTRSLRRLVARYDRDALARRAEAVHRQRDVTVSRLDDGLGRLIYVDEWTKVNAVGNRIRNAGRATQLARKRAAAEAKAAADGTALHAETSRGKVKAGRKLRAEEHHTRQGWSQAFLAATHCRADAILAIVLGREHEDGTVVLDTAADVRVDVEVVIDLATLRGEADRIALLDGTPVPAEVGRQWADHARTFRRMVTDPVTGHLLDRGKQYMADDVRDFVMSRDGGCRIPGCTITHPSRLQADHAQPAPQGATSSANLGALSTTHHQLKTDGYLDITDSAADGSAVLTTTWGQRIVIPPRAYLDEPEARPWDRNAKRWDHDAPPPF